MKEDILEQMAEDYFSAHPGYFTKTNVKYKPDPKEKKYGYNSQTDSVNSDIDVIALYGPDINKIYIVNCKSWQSGLKLDQLKNEIRKAIENDKLKQIGKREYWAHFRELCIRKWTDGFVKKLREESGNDEKLIVDYTLLCTKTTSQVDLDNDVDLIKFSNELKKYFIKIDKNIDFIFSIKRLDFYVNEVINRINGKSTPAVENTHLARTFQLLIASGHKIIKANNLRMEYIGTTNCAGCGRAISDQDRIWFCKDDYLENKFCLCDECYMNQKDENRSAILKKDKSSNKSGKPICDICKNQITKNH